MRCSVLTWRMMVHFCAICLRAMRCPVLYWRMMAQFCAICLRARYAVSGTDVAHGAFRILDVANKETNPLVYMQVHVRDPRP
eukprot:2379522-Rhodomonas_salina.4